MLAIKCSVSITHLCKAICHTKSSIQCTACSNIQYMHTKIMYVANCKYKYITSKIYLTCLAAFLYSCALDSFLRFFKSFIKDFFSINFWPAFLYSFAFDCFLGSTCFSKCLFKYLFSANALPHRSHG